MSWFDTVRGVVEQAYEFISNEETIGDTISEFAYTVQTGYPRYILNNFSLRDLRKFLDSPQLDTFFIIAHILDDNTNVEYGILYKNHSKGEKWYVSSTDRINSINSISLKKFITNKDFEDEEDISEFPSDILSIEEDEMFFSEDVGATEKNILLLRPKIGSFSNERIRKKISLYENRTDSNGRDISSEFYVFQLILSQPEYLDQDMFRFIRDLIYKTIINKSDSETSSNCKKICAFFDDTFKAYRVGLLI